MNIRVSLSSWFIIIALNFLYQLYEKNTKEINDPITKSIGVTLNALYGTTLEGVSTLSLHDLFSLLRSQSYYAVFHSLHEINQRSLSLVKDFSFIMMNNKISRRFMSSISSSLRAAYQSQFSLSQINEDENVDLTDFNETTQSVTLLKDLITACGNGAYGTLRFPISILCSAILINYCSNPQLCTLMWNEGNELYWLFYIGVIRTIIILLGSNENTNFNDDNAIYSFGCFLVSFFIHYQGDIVSLLLLLSHA